ncbi:TonB-dependent receptor [Yersinia pestis subsp. microtus bv. Caucasica]|uniref:TonB-dependent hemoglobin/transferrin/lactoferrin family receptor n=1 Tax=Yersinia pestis TaxID=632 RepID=UPI00015020F6|nr:TonB-dependent hemoglobin/transferrin/lactoferrin family receptor [Yersinia pestis]ABP41884.1 TonB dependent receptor protein [Yersinia pestis Pestoides F]AJI99793.1 hasR protein [Yersinia pestis Pestoides F]AJK25820.1 hasR protein [Yersinia pestis Pestoides G]AKS59229.1 hasR protein [Yersinia pestis 1412]AKS75130.1 hasR protein [Yersinia pestis 1413]
MDNIIRDKKTIISVNKITTCILFALVTQGYSGQLAANTAETPTNNNDMALDKLNVEGKGNAHDSDWIYDEPRSVSEITREQLDNRPARHAADILEQTPGVYSSVSQQDPGLSINIRGIQDYGRVNMNIDGMRQNFMKSGHGQRNGSMYIDPEILSNVVIERGIFNGIGGAGAIGGIATFNTINASDFLAPEKELGGHIRAMTGDNGTRFIGSGALALGNPNGDILLAVSERNLKDYWPGNKGVLAGLRLYSPTRNVGDDLKNTKTLFTGYKMRSQLAKVGWNFEAGQRLEFSYLQTQIASPNASMLSEVLALSPSGKEITKIGWRNTSFTNVENRNIALDYRLNPEHISWLDATAKIYYVDTNDETDNANSLFKEYFWTQTRLKTRGLQLQNTNTFTPSDAHQIRLKYGLEWFSDKSEGYSTRKLIERTTPPGKRAITSTFAQLNYEYDDWLRLEGGLRYDQFRLKGNTWLHTRSFLQPYTFENPCDRRIHEQSEKPGSRCSSRRPATMRWDVDRSEQQLSPTLAMGVKPGLEWLEFFGSYGKSWRPPAMTEVLATGTAHGYSWVLPNPFVAAERARTWEAGFNIQQSNLFIEDDHFAAKVAYFDTRIANYINLELGKAKPKFGGDSFTDVAYVNNLLKTRFRGLEYQLSYDAGTFYTNINYTRMIGVNNVCSPYAWLGGLQSVKYKYVGKVEQIYAVENEVANNYVTCMNANVLFGSSAYLPGDRGSLTLGSRIFDRRLDFGTVIRYNKGYQDRSAQDENGNPLTAYVADWPKYIVYDLYASYKVTNNLILRSSIENITNRAYLVNYGDTLSFAPSRGRTIQGGFEYKF